MTIRWPGSHSLASSSTATAGSTTSISAATADRAGARKGLDSRTAICAPRDELDPQGAPWSTEEHDSGLVSGPHVRGIGAVGGGVVPSDEELLGRDRLMQPFVAEKADVETDPSDGLVSKDDEADLLLLRAVSSSAEQPWSLGFDDPSGSLCGAAPAGAARMCFVLKLGD